MRLGWGSSRWTSASPQSTCGTLARGRTAPIKAFLLDQRRVAGVGNIYADEALHRAGIHPLRPAGRLSTDQYERLREAVIWALEAGIEARGATIDDFRHVDGVWGSFQDRFQVHRREGEPCARCGTTIVKMVVAGRGTYVCETCQPRPRGARRTSVADSRDLTRAGLEPVACLRNRMPPVRAGTRRKVRLRQRAARRDGRSRWR